MYRTNTEPADATPTVQFNTLEHPNESLTPNNNFNRTPWRLCGLGTAVSKRPIHQRRICGRAQINPPNAFTGAINGGARTTVAVWSRRLIRNQLPLLSRRTYGCGGPGTCRSEIVGARSFRLDGAFAWNSSMALGATQHLNLKANQPHGARTNCGNFAATLHRVSSGFAQFAFGHFQYVQFHFVWQRWSIALAAWSLVCPTLRFKHTRKDFATCQ